MSVSFYPELVNEVPHKITCVCGEYSGGEYSDRLLALSARESLGVEVTCLECWCITVEPVHAEPEVQMSNSNAIDILDALEILVGQDFSDRCVGSMSANELLERASVAEAFAPEDSGLTTMRVDNMVYCGRPATYVTDKLAGIREVAAWAMQHGRSVVWG